MMSRDDFATAIDSFLGEMSAMCAAQTPADLRHLLGFDREVQETREALRDASATSASILMAACGLVDEFAHRTWDEVIDKSYAFYIDKSSSTESGSAG